MMKFVQHAANRALLAIAASTFLGAVPVVQADPEFTPSKSNKKTHPQNVVTKSPSKEPVASYSQGGTSMTGSYPSMPVSKYHGHYYVGSAFTARQIVAVDHSGLQSRTINVDEVSNLPTNRSNTAGPDKAGKSKEPARLATGKQ